MESITKNAKKQKKQQHTMNTHNINQQINSNIIHHISNHINSLMVEAEEVADGVSHPDIDKAHIDHGKIT